MFTLEDLLCLEAGAIQTLIRKAERTLLARSLKGAGEPVRALFLSNMPSRAGKTLVEEIDALGPLCAREVEAAPADLVLLARKLADAGEILIGRADAQDEHVYRGAATGGAAMPSGATRHPPQAASAGR